MDMTNIRRDRRTQLQQAISDAKQVIAFSRRSPNPNDSDDGPKGRYIVRGRGPYARGDQMGEYYWVAPTDDPADAKALEWDVIAHVTRNTGSPVVAVIAMGMAREYIDEYGNVTLDSE